MVTDSLSLLHRGWVRLAQAEAYLFIIGTPPTSCPQSSPSASKAVNRREPKPAAGVRGSAREDLRLSTTTETASVRITGIDLSGYMTKDYDRAIAFYGGVLG